LTRWKRLAIEVPSTNKAHIMTNLVKYDFPIRCYVPTDIYPSHNLVTLAALLGYNGWNVRDDSTPSYDMVVAVKEDREIRVFLNGWTSLETVDWPAS
jgi:hypothetical protein